MISIRSTGWAKPTVCIDLGLIVFAFVHPVAFAFDDDDLPCLGDSDVAAAAAELDETAAEREPLTGVLRALIPVYICSIAGLTIPSSIVSSFIANGLLERPLASISSSSVLCVKRPDSFTLSYHSRC